MLPTRPKRAVDEPDIDLRLDVRRVLMALMENDPVGAEVLVRRVLWGQTYTEIAAVMGCFPDSARVIGERVLRGLRRSPLADCQLLPVSTANEAVTRGESALTTSPDARSRSQE